MNEVNCLKRLEYILHSEHFVVFIRIDTNCTNNTIFYK